MSLLLYVRCQSSCVIDIPNLFFSVRAGVCVYTELHYTKTQGSLVDACLQDNLKGCAGLYTGEVAICICCQFEFHNY